MQEENSQEDSDTTTELLEDDEALSLRESLKKDFIAACEADDVARALAILKDIHAELAIDCLSPSFDVSPSVPPKAAVFPDVDCEFIATLLHALGKLYYRRNAHANAFISFGNAISWFERIQHKTDKHWISIGLCLFGKTRCCPAETAYEDQLRWFQEAAQKYENCVQKGDEEWRGLLHIYLEISVKSHAYSDQKIFFDAVEEIISCSKKINDKTTADLMCVVDSCYNASIYYGDLKNTEKQKEYSRKTEDFRGQLFEAYLGELTDFMHGCNTKVKEKHWVALQENCLKAENVFIKICAIIQQVPSLETKRKYQKQMNMKLMQFILVLASCSQKFEKRVEHDKALFVFDVIIKWLEAKYAEKTSHNNGILSEYRNKKTALLMRNKGIKPNRKMDALVQVARVVKKEVSEAEKQREAEMRAEKKRKKAERAQRRAEEQKQQLEQERRKQEQERCIAEEKKRYDTERSKFVGLCRKFNALESERVDIFCQRSRTLSSKIMSLSRKKYGEGSRCDKARDVLIEACEALMRVCDEVVECHRMATTTFCDITASRHKKIVSLDGVIYEELVILNARFTLACNFLTESDERKQLVKHYKDCVAALKRVQVMPLRKKELQIKNTECIVEELAPPVSGQAVLHESVVPAARRARKVSFFQAVQNDVIFDLESFVLRCESLFLDLVHFQSVKSPLMCLLIETELGEMYCQFDKKYPELNEKTMNVFSELHKFLTIFALCRTKPCDRESWPTLKELVDDLFAEMQMDAVASKLKEITQALCDEISRIEHAKSWSPLLSRRC